MSALDRLAERIRAYRSSKLQRDVVWNLGSFVILGVSGILLNVLIAREYGAAALGVFNQTLAAYIIFSQFAAGGVHLSTLRSVAQLSDDRPARRQAITAAVVLTVVLSILFTAAFWIAREPVGRLLDSPGVAIGMAWAAPGLFCFALNKTLLGTLNGLRRMRTFAVAQAARPILVLIALLIAFAQGVPGPRLPLVLSVAECFIAVVLLALLAPHYCRPWGREFGRWLRRHFDFGVRSAGSGVLLELNTRVDVIMLGYFCSDAVVGVYSFAAMLVEGIAQLPVVLRTNINPLLAQHIAAKDDASLRSLIRSVRRVAFMSMLAVAIVTVVVYPLGVAWATDQDEFGASWPVFAILMAGLVIGAAYIPFHQILLQAGRPGTHTAMISAAVAANILLNAVLIPYAQAIGAAYATATAFVLSVVLLRVLARRLVGVSL